MKTHLKNRLNLQLLWLLLPLLILGRTAVWAQTGLGIAEEVRTLYPSEWGVPYPAALSYDVDRDHLVLLNKSTPAQATADATIVVITPYEDLVGAVELPFAVNEAINVTYDEVHGRLLLLNDAEAQVARVGVGADGLPAPATLARSGIAHLGLTSAAGMAVDRAERRLLILDGAAAQLVSVDLDESLRLLSKIDLAYLEAADLRGIAVHPLSHNLFVVNPAAELLYELSPAGQLLNTYDLAGLDLVDPRGLAFGPSADLTDDPDTIHLFIADSNLPDAPAPSARVFLSLVTQWLGDETAVSPNDNARAEATAAPVFGRILEVALRPPSESAVRFAVIGDFGKGNEDEARVAALVAGWNPDFVITTGDNNYPDGEAATIDENVGHYYSQFIGNYQGSYGPGSATNRFWPTLGNHDWHTISCTGSACTGAHFDYFTLPNNERYYDVDLGLVHLFALDSDRDEPDGRKQDSIQAAWLRERLAASTACYNLVYFHHAAYSSGRHGSSSTMQWPFADWGADAVLSGHDHLYERLDVAGTPYFVNGAGGATLYDFGDVEDLPPEATSVARYNEDHGAMLITATPTEITYQFYDADGDLIDEYTVTKNCTPPSAVDPRPTVSVATLSVATISVPTPTVTPVFTSRGSDAERCFGRFLSE